MTVLPVKSVAILGAGITGLSLGWYLKESKRKDISFKIFEEKEKSGGWIQSSMVGRYFFEWGPRSFRSSDSEAAFTLIQELNLASEIIYADPQANTRHLYYNDRLQTLPNSFFGLLKSSFLPLFIRAGLKDLVSSPYNEDESVYAFFSRRFSKKMADIFASALVSGVYAGDAKTLSMEMCFPYIKNLEREFGSLILGMIRQGKQKGKNQGLWTLQNGLSSLTNKIAELLSDSLYLNSPVKKMRYDKKKWVLTFSDREEEFDEIYSTLSLPSVADLMGCEELKNILDYKSVGVVHCGYSNQVLKNKGFGYLVPEMPNENILGVIFDSNVFPLQNQKNQTRLTVMVKGNIDPSLLKEIALKSLARHLKIEEKPEVCHYYVAQNCIPQYHVGYRRVMKEIQFKFPKLSLLGLSFGGISVNQRIAEAKKFIAESFSI